MRSPPCAGARTCSLGPHGFGNGAWLLWDARRDGEFTLPGWTRIPHGWIKIEPRASCWAMPGLAPHADSCLVLPPLKSLPVLQSSVCHFPSLLLILQTRGLPSHIAGMQAKGCSPLPAATPAPATLSRWHHSCVKLWPSQKKNQPLPAFQLSAQSLGLKMNTSCWGPRLPKSTGSASTSMASHGGPHVSPESAPCEQTKLEGGGSKGRVHRCRMHQHVPAQPRPIPP